MDQQSFLAAVSQARTKQIGAIYGFGGLTVLPPVLCWLWLHMSSMFPAQQKRFYKAKAISSPLGQVGSWAAREAELLRKPGRETLAH